MFSRTKAVISPRRTRSAATAVALSATIIGIAAPALALTRTDNLSSSRVYNGYDSARWQDGTPNYADPRVTVDLGCRREFLLQIYKDEGGIIPDKKRGEEWVDCQTTSDAVYAEKKELTAKYHYSVKQIPFVSCVGGQCQADFTSFIATVKW